MTIQISNAEYWKKMEWDDGILYCSLLSIDGKDNWRFITEKERTKYLKSFSGVAWYEEDIKKYGDLILWYQIIDKAKESKKPIILISGDVKEDWWLEKNGKRIKNYN